MDKLDKTKENIGVTNLDNKTREKLFEKFVESGGKVIDDKARRIHLILDREKQRKLQKRLKSRSDKVIKKEKPKTTVVKPTRTPEVPPQNETNSFLLFAGRLKLRFNLKFLGITTFDGYYFKKKFFSKFNNIHKPALMELQILYFEIFKRNLSAGKTIIQALDALKPLYYELIEMTGNLFDKILTDQILEQHINFPEVPKRVSELREPLLQLFRRLYVLNPHEHTIRMAFELAIDLYGKPDDDMRDSPSATKRKMRNDLFIIFHKLYPRLELLYYLLEGSGIRQFGPSIDSKLSITDAEKPGNRMLSKYFDDISAQPAEHDNSAAPGEGKEADNARMKAIKKGLDIMSTLSMSKLRKEYDKARLFDYVSDVDKVFISYLLFNEFDKEYSFILTTNKIKFRTDVISRTQKDFKTSLVTLYDKMKKSADSLREYAEELRMYEKARHEKPLSGVQYIEFSKRMEALEKKKNICGKKALSTVREYMNETAEELSLLAEDMDNHQFHIENPQEELVFDPLIEGEKKLNKKKIYEAIYVVYCYALAFAYRLSHGGDLSGDLEFKKEELELMQKQMEETSAPEKSEKAGDQTQKSILEQLDDLL